MKHLLVTGGCGFIGSNFIRWVLRNVPKVRLTNLDALTYAGNLENLGDLKEDPRYRFVHGDVADGKVVSPILDEGLDAIVHFAAESHVDRSLYQPAKFLQTNVTGTAILLEQAAEHKMGRFVQVSTDEVYGSCADGEKFREDSPLRPSNPYSASKAAADLLAMGYARTFDLDVVITRSSNNYGPYQFPEKLIPLFVTNALEGKPLPLYGDGLNVRDWLFVEDNCRGIWMALERGQRGQIYLLGGGNERTNREVTELILRTLGKPQSLVRYVTDRPAHDRRYALDSNRTQGELGWKPEVGFEEGLARTVRWYCENRDWWTRVRTGEYREFYRRQYGSEL